MLPSIAAGLICLWGLLFAADAAAQPARAVQLQRVVDGDTLVVVAAVGAVPTTVRLQGIDAPEACQAWGVQARAALDEHLSNRALTLRAQGRDSFGRTLATLFADGDEVNAWLVVEGHAWSERIKWDRGPYVKQERVAMALSRGLHATPDAAKPWDFRVTHGPCAGAASPTAPSAVKPAANPAPTPAPSPRAATPTFRCDGRTHCSQMTSCEEARFFLRSCPGVKMDGNRDGVPCERQWCR